MAASAISVTLKMFAAAATPAPPLSARNLLLERVSITHPPHILDY